LPSRPERLPVGRIEREIARDLTLPPVAVRQQPVLVVIEFLAGLDGEFRVGSFDDGVVRRVPSLRRGPASIVIAWAGQIASQSLQAMQRSSPFG
jgi:hypothetical protein